MQLTLVVLPRNPEHDGTFRLDDSLDDFRLLIFGMLFQNEGEGFDNFLHGLVEFRFAGIFSLNFGHQSRDVVFHVVAIGPRLIERQRMGFRMMKVRGKVMRRLRS